MLLSLKLIYSWFLQCILYVLYNVHAFIRGTVLYNYVLANVFLVKSPKLLTEKKCLMTK